MPDLKSNRSDRTLFALIGLSVFLVILSFSFHEYDDWRDGFVAGAVLTFSAAILVFFRRIGKEKEKASELLVSALEKHGVHALKSADLLAVSEAVRNRLDLYKLRLDTAIRDGQAETERKVQALAIANRNLLTHHRLTKRMLQSLNYDEVFKTLLDGVRDRLGFTDASVGLRDGEGGDIVFRGGYPVDDASTVRISITDPGSILARTFWNGVNVFVNTLEGQEASEEDRRVLGDGPAFIVPLIRETEAEFGETARECGIHPEGGLITGDTRCWVRRTVKSRNLTPDDVQKARKACTDCPLFGPVALLVVRSPRDADALTRDAMAPIVSLAKEAELAMKVVGLHHNLRTMAVTDGLTGLYNHREFYHALRKELERGRRYRHTVSLLMIDVDDFKKFNDRFGHPAGDQALREVADLLRSCARATDIVARYGGEEFGVILPESTAGGALMLAERIRTVVVEHKFLSDSSSGTGQHLSVSVGIYSCHGGTDSEDQMVALADEAAYRAKNSGKNRVVVRESQDAINGNTKG